MAKELQNIQKTLQRDTDSIKIEMESLFASPQTRTQIKQSAQQNKLRVGLLFSPNPQTFAILLFASLSKSTNLTNNEPHKWLELEYIYSFTIHTRFPSGPSPIRNSSLKSLLKAYMLHHVYEGQCHKEASKKFPREIKRKATHFQI